MLENLKSKLYGTTIDFVRFRRPAAVLSVLMVLASWMLIFVAPGPNFGIDFRGGTELRVRFCADPVTGEPVDGCSAVTIEEVRDSLGKEEVGLPADAVQRIGTADSQEFMIRIEDPTFGSEKKVEAARARLADAFGENWLAPDQEDPVVEVGIRLAVKYVGERKSVEDIDQVLEGLVSKVEDGKADNEVVLTLPGVAEEITDQVRLAMSGRDMKVISTESVGPKVGDDLYRQGLVAIVITLGLVLVYIGFRFDIAFAPGAVLALVHDVSITMGIFVLLQREINLPMVGALLTIVGYSLNDTIVIYDRIRENTDRYSRTDLRYLINTSINETLARTLATSITTMLAISAFMFMGGAVIQDFALAMFLGIIFGTYSTVYVASPTILVMQDLRPHLKRLLPKVAQDLGDDGDSTDDPGTDLSESEKRRREREQRSQSGA